jgi:AXL receptor tyrosine kinase
MTNGVPRGKGNTSPGSDMSTEAIIAVVVVVASLLFVVMLLLFMRRKRSKNSMISLADVELSEIMWDDDVAQGIPGNMIDPKRLELEKLIGEGNFGNVYKGILDSQTTVAVKGLKSGSQEYFDCQMANCFLREALRMKDLDHPNVMTLMGMCWGKKIALDESGPVSYGPLILLPYMEMGDLRGYLRSKRSLCNKGSNSYSDISRDIVEDVSKESPVPVDLLLNFGYQIGKGMDYISQKGMVHRDLAARNCMLTWDMKVKVSDFGLSRVLEDGKDYYRMGQTCALPIRWMAIESLVDMIFSTETDIVSVHILLACL